MKKKKQEYCADVKLPARIQYSPREMIAVISAFVGIMFAGFTMYTKINAAPVLIAKVEGRVEALENRMTALEQADVVLGIKNTVLEEKFSDIKAELNAIKKAQDEILKKFKI
jgi:hypothetical protein